MFSSSKNPTANTGANRVGALFAQGQSSPPFAAFALVKKRAAETAQLWKPLSESLEMSVIERRGVGTIAANFATKIVTDA